MHILVIGHVNYRDISVSFITCYELPIKFQNSEPILLFTVGEGPVLAGINWWAGLSLSITIL